MEVLFLCIVVLSVLAVGVLILLLPLCLLCLNFVIVGEFLRNTFRAVGRQRLWLTGSTIAIISTLAGVLASLNTEDRETVTTLAIFLVPTLLPSLRLLQQAWTKRPLSPQYNFCLTVSAIPCTMVLLTVLCIFLIKMFS